MANFKQVKKGYDKNEVDAHLAKLESIITVLKQELAEERQVAIAFEIENKKLKENESKVAAALITIEDAKNAALEAERRTFDEILEALYNAYQEMVDSVNTIKAKYKIVGDDELDTEKHKKRLKEILDSIVKNNINNEETKTLQSKTINEDDNIKSTKIVTGSTESIKPSEEELKLTEQKVSFKGGRLPTILAKNVDEFLKELDVTKSKLEPENIINKDAFLIEEGEFKAQNINKIEIENIEIANKESETSNNEDQIKSIASILEENEKVESILIEEEVKKQLQEVNIVDEVEQAKVKDSLEAVLQYEAETRRLEAIHKVLIEKTKTNAELDVNTIDNKVTSKSNSFSVLGGVSSNSNLTSSKNAHGNNDYQNLILKYLDKADKPTETSKGFNLREALVSKKTLEEIMSGFDFFDNK